MSWKLQGSYFESCSCDVVCPCTASFSLSATQDYCRVVLVFHVEQGEIEGVDVGDLSVAAVADTPKVMSEGNWKLGVFIDAAASDEQAQKLGAVFSGSLGGPMSALGPLVSENLGVQRAPIEFRDDGLRHWSRSATPSSSRSRTWFRSAPTTGSRSSWWASFIRPAAN